MPEPASQGPKGTTRVIKKYPNRRLYDTVESRYITLGDIRHLVMEKADFIVIDKKTNEDITRSILLQVIAEQEHGEPMMSQDFLSQMIRAYGGAMQNFVGSYLENSMRLFAQQQSQLRERMQEQHLPDPFMAFTNLAQKNLEFWQSMQSQFFSAMTGTPPRSKNSSTPAAVEDEQKPEDDK